MTKQSTSRRSAPKTPLAPKDALDEARRRADASDANDIDGTRGTVESVPGQRAGEAFEPGSGYGELHSVGDWGWRGLAEHRYGEYPANEAPDEAADAGAGDAAVTDTDDESAGDGGDSGD